jgi:hypothetical protein
MSYKYNRNVTVDNTPTITAGAYSANDVIGGLQEIDINASSGGTIRRVNLIDDDSEAAAMVLYFFDQQPSTIADNAAFAPTVADLKKLIGTVTVGAGDYVTVNSNDYAVLNDINLDYAISDTIWVYAVVTGTPTYTATTDLTFRYTVWVD